MHCPDSTWISLFRFPLYCFQDSRLLQLILHCYSSFISLTKYSKTVEHEMLYVSQLPRDILNITTHTLHCCKVLCKVPHVFQGVNCISATQTCFCMQHMTGISDTIWHCQPIRLWHWVIIERLPHVCFKPKNLMLHHAPLLIDWSTATTYTLPSHIHRRATDLLEEDMTFCRCSLLHCKAVSVVSRIVDLPGGELCVFLQQVVSVIQQEFPYNPLFQSCVASASDLKYLKIQTSWTVASRPRYDL